MPETLSRPPVLEESLRYEPLRAQRDPLSGSNGRARSDRAERNRWRKQTWLGRFVSTYGWRAYAIPLLAALTVFVGYQAISQREQTPGRIGPNEPVADPPSIGALGDAIIGAPPKGLSQFDASLPTGVLPEGEPITDAGARTWHVVPGTTPQIGQGAAKVFTYTIEVEDGVDTMGFGGDQAFARMVTETLASPKSWTHNPQFGFIRIDEGTPDFRVSLTSPQTVREGCGYEIKLEASCYNPRYGANGDPRVFINEARWVRGAVPFQGDITAYRQYVINHEVGHAIGYKQHEPCEQDGQLAPVMMQQTFSTSNKDAAKFDPDSIKPDGKTCRTNPWPYPIP